MSRWRPERRRGAGRLVVGVDRQRAAWLAPEEGVPLECPHADLAGALSALRPRRVDLVAATGLAVHWMQQAPGALAGLAELRQATQARCASLFGGEAADWRIAGDWRLDRPFPCAGLPEATAQDIEQSLQVLGVPVRWHSAWGLLCACAPQLFPAAGWSVLQSPGRLQLWACRDGQVQEVMTLALPPQVAPSTALDLAWQQVRLACAASGSAEPQHLHWLDLCAAGPAPHGTKPVPLPARAGLPLPAHEAAAALALALRLGEFA